MNYLVAVLPDRIQAEAAYSALAKEGLPNDGINILGDGYQSADDYGLIDPNVEAKQEIKRELFWLVSFGFIAGYAFNWLTAIEIIPEGVPIVNHVLGGIFGAGAGALGAYFSGGAVGLTIGSGDALAYRNRLNAGKYLVIVKGTGELTERATRILRQFEPENIQGYTEPIGT
ncbi:MULTISPECIES: hypothetical protein [unclassified Chamaesiphon]|uniref:hypothetical protein n=1 Tax=unclassified Chamaesiphon TaxID=2620921 RepID=UPI00286D0489|nr:MULTISPECIES: hypothetical protein [unclassified Chamaesiphon]